MILIGRAVRDPEIKYTQGAKPCAISKYTLAVDRKFKQEGQPTADFINCVAMGKNGEFAEKYIRKGTKIAVDGRIQTGSYTNRDGQKVYTTDVMVESQEFAESKAASGNQKPQPQPESDAFMDIPDSMSDEMPFN